jgi:hypothetical protein
MQENLTEAKAEPDIFTLNTAGGQKPQPLSTKLYPPVHLVHGRVPHGEKSLRGTVGVLTRGTRRFPVNCTSTTSSSVSP